MATLDGMPSKGEGNGDLRDPETAPVYSPDFDPATVKGMTGSTKSRLLELSSGESKTRPQRTLFLIYYIIRKLCIPSSLPLGLTAEIRSESLIQQ